LVQCEPETVPELQQAKEQGEVDRFLALSEVARNGVKVLAQGTVQDAFD
jgi:hypothetical protein